MSSILTSSMRPRSTGCPSVSITVTAPSDPIARSRASSGTVIDALSTRPEAVDSRPSSPIFIRPPRQSRTCPPGPSISMNPAPSIARSMRSPVVSSGPWRSSMTASARTPAATAAGSPRSARTVSGSPPAATSSEKRTPEPLNAGVFTFAILLAMISSARCCASRPIAARWKASVMRPPVPDW